MTASVFSSLGSLNVLLLTLTGVSLSSPLRSLESHHRSSVGRDVGDNPLLDAQDFLSHFLSTMNLTELRPQRRPLAAHKEPPDYMLELYNRFVHGHTAQPAAGIVRSFKNQDSSPSRVTLRGVRIHPLLFNISMQHHEHITLAELHLFTLIQRARRLNAGTDCKVTIYKIHKGVVWTEEVGKDGRRRGEEEVLEMSDAEELVTKQIHAKDNSWVLFDLTHVVALWRKSGCDSHRLEVHIQCLGSEGEVGRSVEVDIDRSLEGKHNAEMIVFSDDRSRDHKQDKEELKQMIQNENNLPVTVGRGQPASWGPDDHNTGLDTHDELDTQSVLQLQSNLIYDTPPRVRRNVKSQPCKRTPLFVEFKDIGWDSWIIQPLGYEAYECNGVCNPPMTSEVTPTKHAIVQTLLSVRSPEKASRACCVPTKLEPISMLYYDKDNGVVTFNHKYEGMVVAECGCR